MWVKNLLSLVLFLAVAIGNVRAGTEDVNSAPNPYGVIDDWASLPQGRSWGHVIGVEVDPDGESIWTLDRCGSSGCTGSTVDPIQKFDRFGKLIKSFGAGLFSWPHGFFVDRDGNVWATDGGPYGKGNTVFKFNPDGKLVMMLGQTDIAGKGHNSFNWPSDVLVAPNGDIFIADGHGPGSNARIVKFNSEGKFVKEWGRAGTAPGEFDVPHGLAMDSLGRLFVADRSNNRIQVFDQDGKFLFEWKQFGRPSGLYIDKSDVLYVADSQSGDKYNAPFRQGIRVGSAKDGRVTAFIAGIGDTAGMPESLAVDKQGNVFGGFIEMKTLKKYFKH